MQLHTWIPKHDWPEGPWQLEADRLEELSGSYVRLALRIHDFGHWNGYLGVPPEHPWHGVPYDELPDVVVHGGVSYSGTAQAPDVNNGDVNPHAYIYSTIPTRIPPGHYWFVGFDCSHFGDYSPGLIPYLNAINPNHLSIYNPTGGSNPAAYKDQAYVWNQTIHLLGQARVAAANAPGLVSPMQMLKDANKKQTKIRTKKVWPFLQ